MKIEQITTPELWNLERKYEFPKSFEESAILKGIKAEIAERDGNRDKELDELAAERDEALGDASSFENRLEDANSKIDQLEADVERLEGELADKKEEVVRLIQELTTAENDIEVLRDQLAE